MRPPILGWDVGGANIKAVRIQGDGQSEPAVIERPFPLWREPRRLSAVLVEMAGSLGGADNVGDMAVTMTAELADCFATKREGVVFVLDAFRSAFPGIEPRIYGVDGRFRSAESARAEPYEVASANWMATATLVSREFSDAIFIDVGSTTTDIIPIVGGRVAGRGQTDTERLTTGELVYTGALRTPVCAILQSVTIGRGECRVAAEHFAVAADAYLWLGRIEESEYTCETPDGRGRSRSEAGARLARMVCADLERLDEDDITTITENVAEAQERQIEGGIRQVMRRLGPAAPSTAALAGRGAFLARAAAQRAGLTIRALADDAGSAAARSGPAAAVAYLLAVSTHAR